jgi:hypothetical protein
MSTTVKFPWEEEFSDNDKTFLRALDNSLYKAVNIKITIIPKNDNDKEVPPIEGQITGGNISIDGSSAIRRSCNLSLIALKD